MRNSHRDRGWGSGDGNEGEKQVSPCWAEPLSPTPACESNWRGSGDGGGKRA